jgi:hypothetical protein
VAHIAARGASLAVLATQPGRAAIVVVDDRGHEPWRADVPSDFYAPDGFPDDAWVAMSERRVVLATEHHAELLAWDVATGQRVG